MTKITIKMKTGEVFKVETTDKDAKDAVSVIAGQSDSRGVDRFVPYDLGNELLWICAPEVESIRAPKVLNAKIEAADIVEMETEGEKTAKKRYQEGLDIAVGRCNDLTEAGGLNPEEARKIALGCEVDYNDLAKIVGLDIAEDGSRIEDPLSALGNRPKSMLMGEGGV